MMYRKKLEKKITEVLSLNKWRNWERLGQLAYRIFKNIRDVLLPIADASRRFRRKHCRSRRWRVTKDADFTTVCPESFGETRCNGRAGLRGKCKID